MDAKKLAKRREQLLKDLLDEEASYQYEKRAFSIRRIWRLAMGRNYITHEEIKQNAPEQFFGKQEAEQITAELVKLRVHVCEKAPSREELKKLPKPIFDNSRIYGRMPEYTLGERKFVTHLAQSKRFKLAMDLLYELQERERDCDWREWSKKADAELERLGSRQDTLFEKDVESIRQKILGIKQAAEKERKRLALILKVHGPLDKLFPKVDLSCARKIEHKKLNGLWELASNYGFITLPVIRELAPEHIIKTNQVDKIVSFFTDLGVHVRDEVVTDEEMQHLPKPHFNRALVHVDWGIDSVFYGIYEWDEWRFFNAFKSTENRNSSFALDSFDDDIQEEIDREFDEEEF